MIRRRTHFAAVFLAVCLPAFAAVHTEPLAPEASRTLHASPDRCPPTQEHQCVTCTLLRASGPPPAPGFVAPPSPLVVYLESPSLPSVFAPFLSSAPGRAPPLL